MFRHKELKKLAKNADHIASGDYLTSCVPDQYSHEISVIAGSFEKLRQQLVSGLFEMQVASAQIEAAAKTAVHLKNQCENEKGREHTMKELEELTITLQETSDSLHHLTDEINIDLLEANKSRIKKQIDDLVEHLQIVVLKNPTLKGGNAIIHKGILDMVIDDSHRIEAIWTNDPDGCFTYSNPPAGIANASIRDWFSHAINGEVYTSNIYISAISKSPCITVSMPVKDDFDIIVGVIGADLGIKI